MRYDYVVIGAGVSGITTALILAKSGFDVALVEKSPRIAPLIRGFSRHGVYFDTGFHYTGSFGDGEILDLFFRYLGLDDQLEKTPYDPQGFDLIRNLEAGFEFWFPYGYHRIRQRLHATFPAEKDAVDTYLQAVEATYHAFPYISLNTDAFSVAMPSGIHGPSLQQFLDRLTDNRLLKWVLSIHCLLHGVPPEEIPFTNHACIVGPYFESVHGIQGGGGSLVRALDGQLAKLGVAVYCGTGVREIRFAADRTLTGVYLEEGKNLDCRGCVSTVHPRELLNLVPESLFRPVYRKRLERLEETSSAHILYARCDSSLDRMARANVLISPHLDLTGLGADQALQHRPVYLTAARSKKARSFKAGLIAICPASIAQMSRWAHSVNGKRPADYVIFKENMGTQLGRYIETACPEVAGKIDWADCATPLTLRDFSHSPFGSLYGVKHKVGQHNPLPLTKAPGLFLAGQAIVAPGILGAVVSAFLVCGIIIGHCRLLKALRKYR
ncbi:MAG: NAD(P)/FAD-dependent oxidoreductase [Desulfobacterales bacterium]|nr:MAG: NAD(P)/FAD-dependent oxidoreductase [Desulfobacterales bacterium]